MKIKLLFALLLACLLCIPGPAAYAAETGPEDVVREFYTDMPDIYSEEIYKYVYLPTISNLRIANAMSLIDWMYFLCGQEIRPELINDLVVRKAVPVTDTVSLVPVGDSKAPWILVFVQKEKEGWKITKVESSGPYNY